MSAEAIGALVFFGIVFGLGLLCFVLCEVMNFIDKKRNERHHKEHPEFFRLREDFSEKANMACRFHNKEIAPRKSKVDYILKDEPYWPQEVREQKMEEVEKLRREIYTAECMLKGLDKDTQESRQKVVDYVHAHNIKWGGVWE
jgi:hypothetical protein